MDMMQTIGIISLKKKSAVRKTKLICQFFCKNDNFKVDNGHLVNTSIDDNRMSCAFLRPYSVTKEVDGKSVTWDISTTKYNLLFAEGPVTDDGDVTYHDKNKNATQQPINFTNQTIPNGK